MPKQVLTQNTHFYDDAIAQKFIYSVVQESFNKVIVTTKCSYNRNMKFEWDQSKRLFNIRKHGIDFSDVPVVFDGLIVTVEDERFDYGEQRFVTFGLLQGYVVAVVHTESYDYIRIISTRKATKNEQKTYFEQI